MKPQFLSVRIAEEQRFPWSYPWFIQAPNGNMNHVQKVAEFKMQSRAMESGCDNVLVISKDNRGGIPW